MKTILCPKCGSDDWKLASLVHQDGIQHVDTKTKGVGVGVGTGGIGIGIGAGKQTGIHQSDLSKATAPPTDPSSFRIAVGLLMGLCLGYAASKILDTSIGVTPGGYIFISLAVAGLGAWIGGSIVDPKDGYKERLEGWQKTKMCQRCGAFYIG